MCHVYSSDILARESRVDTMRVLIVVDKPTSEVASSKISAVGRYVGPFATGENANSSRG